ncbi:MAG: hypothetical protein ACREO9_06715, partial [Lysobacterales bacterium]
MSKRTLPGDRWLRSGAPWVWLNAAAVSFCILLLGGLLLIIAARGAAHFWPSKVYEFVLQNPEGGETGLVGQIRETESVPLDRLGNEPGTVRGKKSLVTRSLIQTGNREVTGQDFRWILQEQVVQQSAPFSMVVLEREEWGPYFGHVVGLKTNGDPIAGDRVWKRFREMLERVSVLRKEKRELEKGELRRINNLLEQLRLEERDLSSGLAQDSTAFDGLSASRARLEEASRKLEAKLFALDQAMHRDSVVVRTGIDSDPDRDLPVYTIIDAWRPNAMSQSDRLVHFARKIGTFVTDNPREANTEGGIFPAIYGTILMVLLMTLFVTPFGIVAGIYLKEYARQGFLTRAIRIAVHNLAGVPSIVYGVFGLGFFVYTLGGSIDRLFFKTALPSPTFGTGGLLWA